MIDTERLHLRRMTREDYPALSLILQDEETMYAYNGAFSAEETLAWLENQLRRYEETGLGLLAVVLKSSGEMIGQCGLTWQKWQGQRMLEVGYLFRRAYWHQGYATEAAHACMEYAFHTLHAPEVCSIIRDTNLPSQRVALRNGMTRATGVMVKHYRGVDMLHHLYLKPNPSRK